MNHGDLTYVITVHIQYRGVICRLQYPEPKKVNTDHICNKLSKESPEHEPST